MMSHLRSLFALAACALGADPTAAQRNPDNLLILIADDFGVDAMGAYGESPDPAPTPNLDALAARGVLFRNAWANPVCSSTRAGIQTGRYALRTYVGHAIPFGNGGVLQLRELTLPEALDSGASGYAHAAIGKWHLSDERNGGALGPNLAGWSHFAGLIPGGVHNYYSWPRTVNGASAPSQAYATTQMIDDALAWIAAQRGPWVCYVALNAPHTPFHAPPPALHSQQLAGLDPAVTPVPFFKAMVEAMDREIGRLLAGLGPQLNQTNIIFLGDNGTTAEVSQPPFAPSHAKSTPYEGGVNVPLVVAGPVVRQRGREVAHLVGAVDVFATALELAGVDPAAVVPPWTTIDAVSFAPYLTDPSAPALRQTVFAELFDGSGWSTVNTTGFATVRDQRFKLIRFYAPTGYREELYDLVTDPFEVQSLLPGTLGSLESSHYDALAQELDRLRRPSGSLHVFGVPACAGSVGVPQVNGSGTPAVGATYRVSVAGAAASSPALLLLGVSNRSWGTMGLPFPLQAIGGGPGCFFYTSGEATVTTMTDAAGSASLPLAVPNLAAFVGSVLFHSWIITDPTAPNNNLGITTSNGAAAAIGA